ncbi:MAG: phosphoribosylformylglycinamidine synthase subunit PurQ [Candidatus Aenigmarchaeota archaeon]|nr:phosphoribosylformylglycinamidine synthase subunit PurQ [Candidatus Aenigmarchaeota archaeon]
MRSANALVINGAGINCEFETAYALETAGANVDMVHVNKILEGSGNVLENYQMLVLPGGFSYGDEIGAGKILGDNLKSKIGDYLQQFINDGYLVKGICNGAQTIVKMGYAPGSDGVQTATITTNASGRFVDRWVELEFDEKSPASKIFTKGIKLMKLPIRHGEGWFVFDPGVYEEIVKNHQVVARYVDGEARENLHYSPKPENDVAIICNKEGNVFDTMPHPEGYQFLGQSPGWPMEREKLRRSGKPINAKAPGPGQKVFDNMVEYSLAELV